MIEIRHKETNEQYSHISFDSILDTSCLNDTDGTMRKCLPNIYNRNNSIFHYQDTELGTRSCKHLSSSLDEMVLSNTKLTAHLPTSITSEIKERDMTSSREIHGQHCKCNKCRYGTLTSCCDCNNVLHFIKFESDWKPLLDPWFKMFGYDGFTVDLYNSMDFGRWDIFWDIGCPQSTDEFSNHHLSHGKIEIDESIHIDEDEFIWFRVGESFIDDNNDEYGKGLITMGIDQERILVEGNSILCPGGTWHGPTHKSQGVSFRVVVNDTFFHIQDWYSEEHKKLCEYIKSFTYNAKVIRGTQSCYKWSFIDYSRANLLPASLSGGWYGKGHDKNIPKSIEPYIFE